MLTVPGLCWLCRMPLALSHWGICSVCARAVRQRVSLCPQCGLPAAHPSLPCGRCLQKPPLWSRRHWRRGFNQSDLLCQPLARWLGCAWDSQTITRVRATATQHHLSARLRKRNLKNAFRLELPVQGLHMVIVDDVVTTGSTVAEIAQLLLRNGAATVQVWCLCRTL